MITPQELRRAARERRLALDLVEKDYALGWILYGVSSSSLSRHLALKGGTALSKVYFPSQWRLSEDLDFTLLEEADWQDIAKVLREEVSTIMQRESGISLSLTRAPFTNPNYLQGRFQYVGPVSRNTVRIEISKERFVGDVLEKQVAQIFDYPKFKIGVYSLANILAEKIRTLLERGKVRDYYDVWRLLKTERFEHSKVRKLFLQKCRAREIEFDGVDQFFPTGLARKLEPYTKVGLARLSAGPLPPLETMIGELRPRLAEMLG
jgi:predicted nucleotidyltransferase component of viral defense system